MTIRRISILILISIIFWQSHAMNGQQTLDSQAENKVVIVITADAIIDEIIPQVKSNLEAREISVEIIRQSGLLPPDWDILIQLSRYDEIRFIVYANGFRHAYSEASPIFFENYEYGAIVAVRNENRSDTIAKAIKYSTAVSLYSIGMCDEAVPIFNEITSELGETVGTSYESRTTWRAILFLQANCAIERQDFGEAARLLDLSYSLKYSGEVDFASITNDYYLARIFLQMGNQNDALSLMANTVKEARMIPGSGDWYNLALIYSARLYTLLSRNQEAIANLTIYSERFGNDIPLIFVLRGQLYRNIYEWDNSLADFNTALELSPDYADAYYERGLLYYSVLQTGQELRAEALADFKAYLELAPEGQHADEARDYVESIELELQTLNED